MGSGGATLIPSGLKLPHTAISDVGCVLACVSISIWVILALACPNEGQKRTGFDLGWTTDILNTSCDTSEEAPVESTT